MARAAIPIAFHAPLKSPRSPVPSGDRTMARNLMAALRRAGFQPELATDLTTREPNGDADAQAAIAAAAARETDAILARFARTPETRPAAWFTYHCYYKAPDLIGPAIARALAIPYAVAEGSRAAKRAFGPWALFHAAAETALDAADILFAMTARDRPALDAVRPPRQRIVDLPPFLDVAGWPEPPPRTPAGPLRLLAVGMMREGDKLASYDLLAQALALCPDLDWRLAIVGDGPAAEHVRARFQPFGPRVTFHGRIEDRAALAAAYADADLLVWPAVNEAYGMVFLEAQLMGCAVLAGNEGGVASVVADGLAGRLVAPRDPVLFAAALRALADDRDGLRDLGATARRIVLERHGMDAAAATLDAALRPLVEAAR